MIPLGNLISFQDYNGSVLAAGKLYVYNLGRNGLATVYGDVNGAVVLPNPITLDNLGMCDIWLSPVFDYTIIITDAYGQEMFSRDIYPQRPGSGESIGTQLYEGIDPIVVNNDVYAISANTSRLGVVTPLYFVKDDEEETIIGFSAEAIIPSGTMNESAFGFENNKITGYNGSAFSAGNEYEAGSYVDIVGNTINVTGLQPAGDYQSAGNYVSASELENLQPKGDYYSASNPSGFLIDEDITGKLDTTAFSTVSGDFLTAVPSEYVTEDTLQSGLSSKLDSTAFSTVSGNFLTAHQSLEGYATEQWVEEKGYITGIDIQQSADWNEATTVVNNNSAIWNNATNVVSSNSASWGASNPQIPVTGINGIKISESGDKVVFEVSGDYATHDDLTSKQDSLTYGYHDTAISSIDNSALYDSSAHARINTLAGRISDLSSNKLDESAFSDVSGDFATTGDLNDLITSISETYQSKLTFDYNEDSAISAINGSALAGGGSITGDYVSGVNTVNIRPEEWNTGHRYEYTTIISGDVQVRTGEWFGEDQVDSGLYSLSAIGNELGNKLNSDYVTGSTTIKNINNHAEMGNNAYRPNGFNTISANYVTAGTNWAIVDFRSYTGWLYSAIITVETNTTGIFSDNWTLQSFEDGSAILVRKYNDFGQEYDPVSLGGDWNITNIDASAMTYSSTELAPIAFKDDITGITYTTGSI